MRGTAEFRQESAKEVGKRIAMLRNEKKLTQSRLAEEVGVSRSLLASWESGNRKPDVDSWFRLALVFEVSTDFIAGNSSQRISKGASLSDKLDLDKLNDDGKDMLYEFYHMLLSREIFCADMTDK